MTDQTPFSGIAIAIPLPSCADCGAPFRTLADSFCWSCGAAGPAAPGGIPRKAAASAAASPPPPGGPRSLEQIARDIAAAVALARPYLLPPPGTTLRGLLDELVEAVK